MSRSRYDPPDTATSKRSFRPLSPLTQSYTAAPPWARRQLFLQNRGVQGPPTPLRSGIVLVQVFVVIRLVALVLLPAAPALSRPSGALFLLFFSNWSLVPERSISDVGELHHPWNSTFLMDDARRGRAEVGDSVWPRQRPSLLRRLSDSRVSSELSMAVKRSAYDCGDENELKASHCGDAVVIDCGCGIGN